MDDSTAIRRAQQAERRFLAGVVRGWRLSEARLHSRLPHHRVRVFRGREHRPSGPRQPVQQGSDDPHIAGASPGGVVYIDRDAERWRNE